METVLAFLEKIGNYLLLVRFTDILDVIIIAFLVYKLLDLVKSTRAENILKGVVIFLLALWLSEIFHLNGIAYILGNMVQVGILALIILFQPEIRQILEKLGSRNIRLLRAFTPAQQQTELERPSTRRSSPAARCPRPRRACSSCSSGTSCWTIWCAAAQRWTPPCPPSC